MLNFFKTLWRPEAYHGLGKNTDFFEGWFFKLVDAAKQNILAFIPGISLGNDPHAFIQILDGQNHQSSYIRFPVQDFTASSKKLNIQIGDNIFAETGLHLNIETDGRQLTGKVAFQKLTPWPVKLTSPGAMGWYAFVPFMECFHGVISFDHFLHGTLSVNGTAINFDNGRGYIEKDWGRSFPSAYVWIQSNHFEKPGCSLMVSIAQIPWLTHAFRGFIIGFWLDGKLYRFATYTGAKLYYLRLTDTLVQLSVGDKNYLLNIEAIRSDGGLLHAPYQMNMLQRVSETLCSSVKIDLFQLDKKEKHVIFSGEGNPAGLDVNGKIEEILDI